MFVRDRNARYFMSSSSTDSRPIVLVLFSCTLFICLLLSGDLHRQSTPVLGPFQIKVTDSLLLIDCVLLFCSIDKV